MGSIPRLGLVNFALVSAYFVPVWGHDALRVLTSPYNGFEDRAHAVAAIYFRGLFDLGLAGLLRTSELLAGLKLVIAAAFVAYLIEFARALATRREPNRETVDVVLLLAVAGAMVWFLPTLKLGDGDLVRLQATQLLLLLGAAIVILVERQIDQARAARASPITTTEQREAAPTIAFAAVPGIPRWVGTAFHSLAPKGRG
jgi:hypothetical protein